MLIVPILGYLVCRGFNSETIWPFAQRFGWAVYFYCRGSRGRLRSFLFGQGDFFCFFFDTYCVSFPPPCLHLSSNWQNIPSGSPQASVLEFNQTHWNCSLMGIGTDTFVLSNRTF